MCCGCDEVVVDDADMANCDCEGDETNLERIRDESGGSSNGPVILNIVVSVICRASILISTT